MGIEWYLQSFKSGKEQFIPTAEILALLSPYSPAIDKCSAAITLPNGDAGLFLGNDPDKTSSIMIARPIASDILNEAIYSIMQLGNYIFFAPDAAFPIILSGEIRKELPEDMIESLGEPRIANDFDMFLRLLNEMYENYLWTV